MTDQPEVRGARFLEGMAWLDGGIPGPLHVFTMWETPTAAWALELRRAEGSDPAELRLELAVTPPPGAITRMMVPHLVKYEEEATRFYERVTVIPGGPTLTVRNLMLAIELL